MSVPNKHVLQQGPVLAALGRAALAAMKEQMGIDGAHEVLSLPSEELVERVAPRPRDLVRDFVKNVGGDPDRYKKTLPPHLFPQWAFPIASRTLVGIPYPIVKVMNGGCRLEINHPLPNDEPLEVRGQLVEIDDDGFRAVLHQRLTTSTASAPNAVVAHLYAIVPIKKREGERERAKPHVPLHAREIWYGRIRRGAGLDFAKLTGDFNPIHWIPAYAKASGFKSTILHGFATMGRAIEGLNNAVVPPGGRLSMIDVKFTRPLLLPAKVGIYVDDEGGVFVGDAPGGPAYLMGTFSLSKNSNGATS
jgi:hypothetical protein